MSKKRGNFLSTPFGIFLFKAPRNLQPQPTPPPQNCTKLNMYKIWGGLQKCTQLREYQSTGGTLAGEALSYSTNYPNSLDLESAEETGLRPSRHVGWPSGLLLLAIAIVQCAASLAAGGYDWPCGPINSLFLLSPACCLIVRPYDDSSELSNTTTQSYSYCNDHHLHQGSPLVKLILHISEGGGPPLRIVQNSLIGREKGVKLLANKIIRPR